MRHSASAGNQKCVRNATFPIAHSCDLAEIYRTIIARGTLRRVGVSYQNNGGGRARFLQRVIQLSAPTRTTTTTTMMTTWPIKRQRRE